MGAPRGPPIARCSFCRASHRSMIGSPPLPRCCSSTRRTRNEFWARRYFHLLSPYGLLTTSSVMLLAAAARRLRFKGQGGCMARVLKGGGRWMCALYRGPHRVWSGVWGHVPLTQHCQGHAPPQAQQLTVCPGTMSQCIYWGQTCVVPGPLEWCGWEVLPRSCPSLIQVLPKSYPNVTKHAEHS